MRRMLVTALVPVLVLGGVGAAELAAASAVVAAPAADVKVWDTPKEFAVAEGMSTPLEMVTTKDGATVAVWNREINSTLELKVAVRPAGSATWGAAYQLATLPVGREAVKMVSGTDGSVTVAWVHDEGATSVLRTSVLAPGATSWTAPEDVASGTYVGDVRLAAGPSGRTAITWSIQASPASNVYSAERTEAGGTWSAGTRLDTTDGREFIDYWIDVVVSGDGSTTAVWIEETAETAVLKEATKPAGSGTWSAPRTISDVTRGVSMPRLAPLPDGSVMLVWKSWSAPHSGTKSLVATRKAQGADTWDAPETVSVTMQDAPETPRPLVGPNGEVTLVWMHRTDEDGLRMRASTRSASGSWLPVATVSTQAPMDFLETDAEIGADGTIRAGWSQELSDGKRVFATAARVNGVWSAPKVLSATSDYAQGVVTAAADGNATALWTVNMGSSHQLWSSDTSAVDPTLPVEAHHRDYVGKDKIADLYTVKTTGELGIYGGTANGRVSTPVKRVAWPTSSTLVPFGDVNGDGCNDTLVRNSAGELYSYRAVCGAVVEPTDPSARIGSGWNVYNAFTSPGDLDKDGTTDLLARETSTGRLWFYGGDGKGAFKPRTLIGAGWGPYTVTGTGDLNGDGIGDLVARDSDGILWNYPGNGQGAFGTRVRIGGGWNVYKSVVGVGDLTGDGKEDLVAADGQGALWRYDGLGDGTFKTRFQIGTSGWQNFKSLS
ncbi:FG-GAP-like repeat-containing protein [Streptomyces mesophilus]|uniref:FG-GAP-like repeat-containing protein n=1 Tax=Streptomyces mesophilus TaxID=1775132 RepID=UPI0033164FC3